MHTIIFKLHKPCIYDRVRLTVNMFTRSNILVQVTIYS